jgi:hypothetical protein
MKRSEKYPQLLDEAWLREQYETLGKSCPQIAAELGCTSHLVAHRANQYGIKLRGRHGGKWRTKQCERCGADFTPSGPAARFCSAECRVGTMPCEQCGAEFVPTLPKNVQQGDGTWHAYKRRFCSHECLTAWRGENCSHRWVNSEGYVEITVEPTLHKDVDSNGYVRINFGTGKLSEGRVKEHRWVMEQRLGRHLLPNEEIHHKNAIRVDNDRCPNCPTRTAPPRVVTVGGKERLHCETCGWRSSHAPNLELWDTSQPRGGRVADKISWAIEFLSWYGQVKFTPGSTNSQAASPADGDVTTLF